MDATPVVGYLLPGPPGPAAGDADDAAGLVALHDALGRHTPTLEPDPPCGCWLDLRAMGRRAAPIASRAAAFLATAREWGYPDARLGVAPTPGVARLAARHGPANPAILAGPAVAAFLTPLPLAALGLDEAVERRLALVGLHTLGALAALPRGDLGDYLGAAALPLEALARGEDGRPLRPARPPLVLEARRAPDHALADRARLDALAGRLLAPLAAELARRGLGATRARLRLELERGRPLVVEVALPTPTTDPRAILRALAAALPPLAGAGGDGDDGPDGVAAVAITLSAPRPPVGRQASFFDLPTGRRGLLRAGLREAGRRGDGRIGRLQPVDPTHPLPERRYALLPALPPEDEPGGAP